MKPFEVFRTGTHSDSKGREIVVTRQMLEEIAANYNSGSDQAPIVVGHPKTNDPAYGWVKSFSVDDGVLLAHPDQVEAQFEKLVADGRFKKRSISLYAPDSDSNPVPGQFFPRHVGFLGAKAPAIDGLKDVAFSDDDSAREFCTDFEVEASDAVGLYQAGVKALQKIADTLGFASGAETQNITIPNPKNEDNMKNKDKEDAEFEQRKADVEAREKAADKRDAEFAKAEAGRRAAYDKVLIDGLEADGKVPPGAKAGLLAFMAELPAGDDCTIEFALGDETVKQTPRDYFRAMISGAKPMINFSEVSADNDADDDDADDAQSIADKAAEFVQAQAEKGVTVSMADAVTRVSKDKK